MLTGPAAEEVPVSEATTSVRPSLSVSGRLGMVSARLVCNERPSRPAASKIALERVIM
jgi:hypothetical protein